jgi:hypothetical protein
MHERASMDAARPLADTLRPRSIADIGYAPVPRRRRHYFGW